MLLLMNDKFLLRKFYIFGVLLLFYFWIVGEIEEFVLYVFVLKCRIVIFVLKVGLWLIVINWEESLGF